MTLTPALAALALALAAPAARAAPSPVDAPDAPADPAADPADPPGDGANTWFGAFWGVELRGGVASRMVDPSFEPMADVGLGVRVATLMTLVDAELGLDTLGLTRLAGPREPEGARTAHDLRLTSVGVDLRLHPLFMRYLQGDTRSMVLASVHLALGAGLEILGVSGRLQDDTDLGFGLRVGAGVEVPLTRPNAARWSLWLGLAWRMTLVGFSDAPPGLRDMDRQVAWLSVSFRWHDIDFARLPHPTELRDD